MSLRYDWPPKRGTSVGLAIGYPPKRVWILRLLQRDQELEMGLYHRRTMMYLLPDRLELPLDMTISTNASRKISRPKLGRFSAVWQCSQVIGTQRAPSTTVKVRRNHKDWVRARTLTSMSSPTYTNHSTAHFIPKFSTK